MGIEPGTFSRYQVEMRYEIYLDGGVNHYAKRTTSRVVIPFMAKFIEYRILELNTPPRTALPGECRANRTVGRAYRVYRTTGLTGPLG